MNGIFVRNIFKSGDQKKYTRIVTEADVAAFNGEVVHLVYATFSLARDAEWTTRQFVLEMCEKDEEGVGTFLSIDHNGPAFVGEEIIFKAWIDSLERNELTCHYEARVGNRLIATGRTGQKILKKKKIKNLMSRSKKGNE